MKTKKSDTMVGFNETANQWRKEAKLPTLDEMIGIDKFNLTESQRHDCRSQANHWGLDAGLEQAKKFVSKNEILKRGRK